MLKGEAREYWRDRSGVVYNNDGEAGPVCIGVVGRDMCARCSIRPGGREPWVVLQKSSICYSSRPSHVKCAPPHPLSGVGCAASLSPEVGDRRPSLGDLR